MSHYLVNNSGRVVVIDDKDEADRLVAKSRFRLATDDEIARENDRVTNMIEEAEHNAEPEDNSIFYSTVRSGADGYGMSRDMLRHELRDLGVNLREKFKNQKVGLLYNYPYNVVAMQTDVRLVYTMFESDEIPADWVEPLDEADEVIVPSGWCAEVFAKRGIKATVVPLGYNSRVFDVIKRDRTTDDPFTFIHYDSFNLRKGYIEVFNAFTKEFGKDENVKLIMKTVKKHVRIPILPEIYPNIEVIKGEFSEGDLAKLLGRADLMIYPSRGEGFGITPLEAAATGITAIIPNAHGISEYFDPDVFLEVKADDRCPGLYNKLAGIGEMVVCDEDDLRRQMRWAYEHQDEVREMGQRASEYVKQYTYANTAKALKVIIDKWMAKEVPKKSTGKYLEVEKI